MVLVPNVLDRTPPFVEVRPGSPGRLAGMRPDDLILLVDNRRWCNRAPRCKTNWKQLEADAEVRLTLMRGNELIEVQLKAGEPQVAVAPRSSCHERYLRADIAASAIFQQPSARHCGADSSRSP